MSQSRHSISCLIKSAAGWLAALVLVLPHIAASAEAHRIHIHRIASFQPDSVEIDRKSAGSATGNHTTGTHELHVFGKQLRYSLQDNQKILDTLPANTRHPQMLQGKLDGNDHSWIRLTRTDTGTHGLIWDGSEMYVVEPGNSIKSELSEAAGQPVSDTVIFRMSDTSVDLGQDYCGSDKSSVQTGQATVPNGLATYQSLTGDLADQAASNNTATLRLEMQVLADAAFRAEFNSDQEAMDALMVRMNNIDGIFNGQLGLEIQASNVQIYDRDPSLLGSSNDAGTLLNSLGQLRNSSAEMGTYAVTHLFTGRDLDGDTLGIAYIGNVCNTHYGVGLSEVRDRGAWIDSLVAAHELGHQLGAVHDGTGACGSSPSQGFLMDAYINGNSAFSQCNKDLIKATMQNAACLVPIGDNIAFTSIPAANAVTESKASGGAGSFNTIWLFVLLSGVICRFQQGNPASQSNCGD